MKFNSRYIAYIIESTKNSSKGWKDQLIRFKDKGIQYDTMGRPTSIGNNNIKWDFRGKMIKYGNNQFSYNLSGIRDSKNNTNLLF